MSARLDLRGVSWTPAGRRTPVLRDVDLAVEPGERVLLVGPSGGGKSTLLRAAAGVLTSTQVGELTGEVLVDGRPVAEGGGDAALLLQDPRDARVAETVGRDVAFACENAGMPRERIADAVAEALELVGFPYGTQHPTAALSGGEAQRLALAGVVASGPGLLLLDEPTSMLDETAAATVRAAVVRAAREATLVVVEHRLDGWVELLDRLVVLDADGRVVADGPTSRVLERERDLLLDAGIWVPGAPDPTPLDVPPDLVVPRLHGGLSARGLGLDRRPPRTFLRGAGTAPVRVLDDVDAEVTPGRILAVRGASGAGKSTLVAALCGLEPPTRGAVTADPGLAAGLAPQPHRWSSPELAARIGWVPQDAATTVVGRTARESLLATARALRLDGADATAEALADVLGLRRVLRRDPHRLSGGEQRRLAVASALLHGPGALGLDEPTVGQDRHTWAAVAGLVAAARVAGSALAVATHDDAFAVLADTTLRLGPRPGARAA